jgi:hypothetical protein
MKTIFSAMKHWTKKQINEHNVLLNDKINSVDTDLKNSVADWSENNPESSSYVKNRTHSEKIEEIVLLDKLTTSQYEQGNFPMINLVAGDKYRIILNDVVYEDCECIMFEDLYIISDNIDSPTIAIVVSNSESSYNLSIDTISEDFVISLVHVKSTIQKLDTKYLPMNPTFEDIALIDKETGYPYFISVINGAIVAEAKVMGITVSQMPYKLIYANDEEFDPEGMIVVAFRADNTEKDVTNLISDITRDGNIVTIKYTEKGITYKTSIEIEIIEQLEDFEYTFNKDDGTVTLTAWKQKLSDSEMILPDDSRVVL